MPTQFEIPLRGPSGEPVDLFRTFMSHGVADLLPGRVDEAERTYTTTLAVSRSKPRTIRISQGRTGCARVEAVGPKLGQRAADDLAAAVRRILNLDEDLSDFYALVTDDPRPVVGGFGSRANPANSDSLRSRHKDDHDDERRVERDRTDGGCARGASWRSRTRWRARVPVGGGDGFRPGEVLP